MGNNITCSINCGYRIAGNIIDCRNMVCFRYITINSLHEGGGGGGGDGDDDDDDDDDNNNNNNDKTQKQNLFNTPVRQRDKIMHTCVREERIVPFQDAVSS